MEQGKYIVKGAGTFRDLWTYRNLFIMLIRQQFALFYNRAVFGVAWMVLNPLIYLSILVGVFFQVAGVRPNVEIPFVLAAFTGLVMWNFFSHCIVQGTNLLRNFQPLISKIYFPRIYVLYSQIANLFLEYITGCLMLLILLYVMQYPFHWTLFYLIPLFLYSLFVFSGIMIITSLLSYQYKDFQFLVPFLIQLGFYVSPIWFSPLSIKNPVFIFLYYCNPVVGAITLMRASVLGTILPVYANGLIVSFCSGAVFFLIGAIYWAKKRQFLADIGV